MGDKERQRETQRDKECQRETNREKEREERRREVRAQYKILISFRIVMCCAGMTFQSTRVCILFTGYTSVTSTLVATQENVHSPIFENKYQCSYSKIFTFH